MGLSRESHNAHAHGAVSLRSTFRPSAVSGEASVKRFGVGPAVHVTGSLRPSVIVSPVVKRSRT